jgi:hypothetical protein
MLFILVYLEIINNSKKSFHILNTTLKQHHFTGILQTTKPYNFLLANLHQEELNQ